MKNQYFLLLLGLAFACQPAVLKREPAVVQPIPGQPVCVPVVQEWEGRKQPGELCILLFRDDTLLTNHSFWYLTDSVGVNRLLGSSFADQGNFPVSTYEVRFSENGQFGALMMVGEGHPWVEVFSVAEVVRTRSYQTHFMLNPYPGGIELVRWEQNRLVVNSEMPLERIKSDAGNTFTIEDDEAAEKNGSPAHQFAFDPLTKITTQLPVAKK